MEYGWPYSNGIFLRGLSRRCFLILSQIIVYLAQTVFLTFSMPALFINSWIFKISSSVIPCDCTIMSSYCPILARHYLVNHNYFHNRIKQMIFQPTQSVIIFDVFHDQISRSFYCIVIWIKSQLLGSFQAWYKSTGLFYCELLSRTIWLSAWIISQTVILECFRSKTMIP